MQIFSKENWFFGLRTPEYEIPVFGKKVGELRLISLPYEEMINKTYPSLDSLRDYMTDNQILACTFRGQENLRLIQYLNELGFKFIATYNTVSCNSHDFKEIKLKSDLETTAALKEDYEEILEIESKVFDYSTFQIDPFFQNEITSYRNCLRVKSYFNNPDHRVYILRSKVKITGFLQFVLNREPKTAEYVNGAIAPEFQGISIGSKLYSDSFMKLFSSGIEEITSGYCTQNMAASKILKACNFKIVGQEIHLRMYSGIQ